jgi:HEAT repeat protein
VRASLISAVPATGIKEFLKPIRDAVSDADPEVRRASVWALLEYGDQKSVKSALDLLRDPVERVRKEAARALASRGTPSVLEHFEEILADENEVEQIKEASIEGLAVSQQPESVDLLVDRLRARAEELTEACKTALAQKHDHKQVKRIIERLKDADPDLRDALTDTFRMMGENAEVPLLELLHEEITSLQPHVSYVLEQTGFVEHAVRQLNHRDPEVRRRAADNLSRIGTTAAFRGIVLASRDPDDEVRVMVTRALERLNSESGNEILEQLKNDPDKRIRKYTLWALERIRSKNSE